MIYSNWREIKRFVEYAIDFSIYILQCTRDVWAMTSKCIFIRHFTLQMNRFPALNIFN